MKTVTRIQTQDSLLHETERDAKQHADKVYGEALSNLAHRLVRIEKYSEMMEFLDVSLDAIGKLKALRDDTVLEASNDTEQ